MALESDGRLLYPFVVLGGGRQGDLQKALKTTVSKQSLLVADVDTSGNIAHRVNIWAKFKPFINAQKVFPFDKTQSTPQLRSPERWAAARTANYGLSYNYPSSRTIQAIFGHVWTYNRPVIGRDPLRVLDFDGYYGDAQPPVIPVGDLEINRSLYSHYDFSTRINIQKNVDSIGWDDISDLDNFYFCVVFAKQADFSTASVFMYKTSSETFAQGNPPGLVLSGNDLDNIRNNGFTHYFLCAASAPYTDMSQPIPASDFLPLPCEYSTDLTGKFTVIAGGLGGDIDLKWACFTANPSGTSSFVDVSTAWSSRIGSYLPIGEHYCLSLGIDVTAGNTPVTISKSLRMNVYGNFADGDVEGILITDIRDDAWNSYDSISVPANTTKTIYLITTGNILNVDNTGSIVSVQSGLERDVIVRLTQNNTSVASFMLVIKNSNS